VPLARGSPSGPLLPQSIQYNIPSSLNVAYSFVAKNFDQVAQTDTFKNLSKPNLVSLITKLNSSMAKQPSVYSAILSWTHQNESRKVDFTELFLHLDLELPSIDFLQKVVLEEPLVKQSNECLNAVLSSIFAKLECNVNDLKCMKILCVNGCNPRLVFEFDGCSGDISKPYPLVPNKPNSHRLLKLNDFVYCIGGLSYACGVVTNQVYQLNLTESNLKWRRCQNQNVISELLFTTIF